GFERGQRKKIMTSPAERKRMHELNNSPRGRRPIKRRKLAAACAANGPRAGLPHTGSRGLRTNPHHT
ncbi:hypothetical protein KBZ21_45685, partial [Streptomyces sp. A73]|nr:hypothetical protein [Streptomyces sp. A73]